jgi:hypothetical protein
VNVSRTSRQFAWQMRGKSRPCSNFV